MCSSVGDFTLHATLSVGLSICSSLILQSPIGVLGGALVGFSEIVLGLALNESFLPRADSVVKVVAFIAGMFFASALSAFGVVTWAGYTVTFGHVVVLAAVNVGLGLALNVLIAGIAALFASNRRQSAYNF